MEPRWYIRRGDKDYGPYDRAQMQTIFSSGRLQATDLIGRAGETTWRLPHEMMRPAEEAVPMARPVNERIVQMTCLACFHEFAQAVALGSTSVDCPNCSASVEIVEAPERNAIEHAFKDIEDPSEAVRRKVREAYAAAEAEGTMFRNVGGMFFGG